MDGSMQICTKSVLRFASYESNDREDEGERR